MQLRSSLISQPYWSFLSSSFIMPALLVLFLLFFSTGIAVAGNSAGKATGPIDSDPGTPDGRQGGETTSDAFLITSMPFVDAGNTSDNIDDYDEVCPYTGSTSPEVVYVYKPLENESIDISLCESEYDTKLYIYEAHVTPGAPYACNDDADCATAYRSALNGLLLTEGTKYYIVIDGYGGDAGDYLLNIDYSAPPGVPCEVHCPEDGVDEGEPPLVSDYIDQYNSGCDGTPPVFQHIDFPVLCATSGTYMFQGELRNDSDWYSCLAAAPGWISLTCYSELGLDLSVLHVTECSSAVIALEVTGWCEEAGILEFYHPGGSTFWLQCRPTFQMAQAYEFNYLIYIEGIETGSVPVDQASWGEIKTKFK
jgi:hypothetical protein